VAVRIISCERYLPKCGCSLLVGHATVVVADMPACLHNSLAQIGNITQVTCTFDTAARLQSSPTCGMFHLVECEPSGPCHLKALRDTGQPVHQTQHSATPRKAVARQPQSSTHSRQLLL
jgi:hypothetical protein